jgi:hypothetical protein
MYQNPHAMDLGRLRLVRADGTALTTKDVAHLIRKYDLWNGLHTGSFDVDGQAVRVETCVHPVLDLVAVRMESALLRQGRLVVVLDFPYPTVKGGPHWAGNWEHPEKHRSDMTVADGSNRADIHRTADSSTYTVSVAWSQDGAFRKWPASAAKKLAMMPEGSQHTFILSGGKSDRLEFVCGFAARRLGQLPGVAQTRQATAEHWQQFWKTGGAIDLSQSKDPRWKELERRIVLSQYQMAAQSAGSWPSAEDGLMGIDCWSNQFHMEMVWWHLAHYGLWDRWSMAEKALGCYERFLPMARQLAKQFDYRGAKWGKMVGPEGRTATWDGSFVLGWQQPHPIFFAELEYRLRPTPVTLKRWKQIVFDTADYMADFPVQDKEGIYHLRPIMPACEEPVSYDTVFELAYWRFGLEKAQQWRQRLGLRREPHWDRVLASLAPLPVNKGVYTLSPDRPDRQGGSHPDAIGVYGMLPPLKGVDQEIAKATMKSMMKDGRNMCWGWDFPWMAMAAARHGEPAIAIEALLHPSPANSYDQRGVCKGGPCPYLPGNGGLLYAVAMMAAGWDGGPTKHAPGFPDDGSWVVKWEGLKRAP